MTTSETGRARRFSLPDFADERTDEAIDAFISGPGHQARRSQAPVGPAESSPFGGMVGRMAWMEALARESARNRRYRRPAAVVIITARVASDARPDWTDRVAGPVAHAIRRGAREADLVTRVAAATFQVLLPETTRAQAQRFADRIVADCNVWLQAMSAPLSIRAASAATTPDTTLEDALERATAAIAAA
jgi:GGDEF domain-containing protein